jgi:hypothetical protein
MLPAFSFAKNKFISCFVAMGSPSAFFVVPYEAGSLVLTSCQALVHKAVNEAGDDQHFLHNTCQSKK